MRNSGKWRVASGKWQGAGGKWQVAAGLLLLSIVAATPAAGQRKFYSDDPITREPETQDVSGAVPRDISLIYDLGLNLFVRPGESEIVRAQNINTIDEVPDSSWFTNRDLSTLSIEELSKGPNTGFGPAPGKWTVIRAKKSGVSPGFTVRDSAGETWFVQFDAPGHDQAASGAAAVATKIFHALGYFQTENYISRLRPEDLTIDPQAKVETPSGRIRPMKRDDITQVLKRANRQPDGSYRLLASRGLPGKILGGFMYHGTRSDDPNDVVPHENRRELRALRVFGAWTNLVDMKALNTLDTLITENGRSYVRHYLQDVGSTFGTGALGPREFDEGYEYLWEGDKTWKRLVTLNLYLQPWQTVPYHEYESIGRFEGDRFDPRKWKPRVPTAAFLRARPDDDFWAARRVMAFSDEIIRAIVKTGEYSDPAAERHLADVLIKRRDKIGAAYLPAVNPLVDFALDTKGVLTFVNAAVQARVASPPANGYQARWFRFDNETGEARPLGSAVTVGNPTIKAPVALPGDPGAFVKIEVAAVNPSHATWKDPVQVYFRRTNDGWKLVGLERMP
ncbi:MAG: hypothetical protein EHM23_32055 [Acidobacteria bacterium]|nr:MAG: hypothetical protein EHM23_32055 [Acidobacteriota bacterium]